MSKTQCDICQGRGTIRLPVYKPRAAPAAQASMGKFADYFRDFACPECSPTADDSRVTLIHARTTSDPSDAATAGADLAKCITASLAHAIARALVRRGFINITSREIRGDRVTEWTASLGVVGKGAADRIEKRIKKNQEALAKKVADEAFQRIANWSPDRVTAIFKEQAAYAVSQALAVVLERDEHG